MMADHCYAECHQAECLILFSITLSVDIFSVVAPISDVEKVL
jgi:hypothetical protein